MAAQLPVTHGPQKTRWRGLIWLRRLGVGLLVTLLGVTALSLVFNLATRPPETVDPGFGLYVHVGSSDIHYQRWGDAGSPIVLVPGFLESSIVWSAAGPLLGEHHRVYALDLPGPGYTRYTGPMTVSSQAELVEGFITTLGLHSPLLVGHSLGAAIVGSVALRHPRDVGAVVFADGDALPFNPGPRPLRAALLHSPFSTSMLRLAARWPWAAQRVIAKSCAADCPKATATLAREWVRPLRQAAGERALKDLMLNADYGLTPEQISAIAVPTSIIWGSDDHQGGSLDATITNLHHPPVRVIKDAGHLTMLAHPGAFAQAVESAVSHG